MGVLLLVLYSRWTGLAGGVGSGRFLLRSKLIPSTAG